MSGKTQPPTARKLREARRAGDVPRSRFLGAAASLGGAAAVLCWSGPSAVLEMRIWTTRLLSGSDTPSWMGVLERMGRLTLPTFAGAMSAALVASIVMTGLHWQPRLLLPRMSRMDLIAGLARCLGSEALLRGLGTVGIVLLISLGVGLQLSGSIRALWSLTQRHDGSLAAVLAVPLEACAVGMALLFALGLLHAGWSHWRYRSRLMMSREELRQEWKEAEGDPLQKQRRRALHRQLAAVGPARGIAAATVVLVNPTHLTVALRYAPREAGAPYVVAKGREQTALELKAEARMLGLPVVRDLQLTRRLFGLPLGAEIPEELYEAAAAILKIVHELPAGGGAP